MWQDQPALPYRSSCDRLALAGGRNSECKYCAFAVHRDKIRRQVLTCLSPDLGTHLNAVGGFEFDDVVGLPTPEGLAARYIPQIKTGLSEPQHPSFAVASNARFISRKLISGAPLGDLKHSLRVSPDVELILTMFGKDLHIEELWSNWSNVVQSVARSNVSLVIAPDFSLLWDEPRYEHLWNMKRAYVAFSSLQREGVPAIPNLFWHRTIDIDRHVAWLNTNPDVRLVAINLQDCKSRCEKKLYFDGLASLVDGLRTQVRFVVAGLQGIEDIKRLATLLGDFHLTNAQAYFPAFWRERLTFRGGGIRRAALPSAEPTRLFNDNCRVYEELLAGLFE